MHACHKLIEYFAIGSSHKFHPSSLFPADSPNHLCLLHSCSITSDAYAQPWSNLRLYAFPPFILLGRINHKVRQENVEEVVVITLVWENQSWFPLLLWSLVDLPIILLEIPAFLSNPLGELHPLILQDRFRLAAWKVCRVESKIEAFLRMVSRSSSLHGGMAPIFILICLVKVDMLVQ